MWFIPRGGAGHAAARPVLSPRVYNPPVESSVKERLTGALIFVAAAIVIVPEMLSGPDPQPAAVTATQPADAGPPLRTYTITLDDSAQARGPAPSVPVAEVKPAVPMPPPEPPAVAPTATAETAPVVAATVAAPPATPKIADTAPAASGNWWLRVGIFGVRANAERLAGKLRTAGFAVEVDKQVLGGKDMFRVRAGPVRDRAEALALQGRLKASGNDSLLLPP
jgi:DedD protein